MIGHKDGRPILVGVNKNGWAYKHTNLSDYIGWKFTKVNSYDIENKSGWDNVKCSLQPGEIIMFTLQKVHYFKRISVFGLRLFT